MEKEEGIQNNKCNDAPPIACDLTNNPDILNMNQNKDNTFKNKNKNNYNKAELNKHKININIVGDFFQFLSKDYLIDLILFLKNFCQMTIEEKDAIFNHEFFKIEKDINNINEYLIVIKDDENKISNNQNKVTNNLTINDYLISREKENITRRFHKDKKKQNNNVDSKIYKPFICLQHNKTFKTKEDYKNHCEDTHKYKCQKCNLFFSKKSSFNRHPCNNETNTNDLSDINEINKIDEYDTKKTVESNENKGFESHSFLNKNKLVDFHFENSIHENKKEKEEEYKENKKLNNEDKLSNILEKQRNEKPKNKKNKKLGKKNKEKIKIIENKSQYNFKKLKRIEKQLDLDLKDDIMEMLKKKNKEIEKKQEEKNNNIKKSSEDQLYNNEEEFEEQFIE